MIFSQKLATKINFIFLILVTGIFFFIPMQILANIQEQSKNSVFIPENLVYENIFWAMAQNINLKAQMKDDVYLAGLNVEVSGPIEGDLIVVGSNVVISSEIKGNLRVAGGTIIIKGRVEKNVTVAGGMITLASEAEIGKNLIMAGGNVEINGKVNKNLYGAAGNLILNNEILGSAYLTIEPEGNLVLYPESHIQGNLEYTASSAADIKAGAKIGNEEKFTEWQIETKTPVKEKFSFLFLIWWLAGLLGALVVGLVIVIIFKDYTLKIEKKMDKNIGLVILKGLIYLIVTPIALLILAITIIGLPLAIILSFFYGFAIYISKIFVGVYLGEKLIRLFKKKVEIPLAWSMILGLVIIYLFYLIPYFGYLIKLIIILWGLGVLLEIIKKDLKLENV